MLATRNIDIKGKTVLISGSGNVAQYATEKCIQLGAKVLTLSDSDGYIYDPDGIDADKLELSNPQSTASRGAPIQAVATSGAASSLVSPPHAISTL